MGSSNEELLTVIKDIWRLINEYDLLPTERNEIGEEMAPGRSREPTTVVIGVDELPEPTEIANARATE